MTNAQNVVSKINASITTLQELLEEGITSEEIMRSYRANLRSTEQQQLPLSHPQIQESKGSKLNKEDIEEAKILLFSLEYASKIRFCELFFMPIP